MFWDGGIERRKEEMYCRKGGMEGRHTNKRNEGRRKRRTNEGQGRNYIRSKGEKGEGV